MSAKNNDSMQRMLAIVVIIAMMLTMGIPLPVIIFFAFVIYFVWRAVQHSERQEAAGIFDFYINASEILRDSERRWYGFEIAKTIKEGENILHEMRDPPPLLRFTLGALAHRLGDYALASDHLSFVLEDKQGDETTRLTASHELIRYVQILRELEREPARGPQTMAAVRTLERLRDTRAAQFLEESRERAAQPPSLATERSSLSSPPRLIGYPRHSSRRDAKPPTENVTAKAEISVPRVSLFDEPFEELNVKPLSAETVNGARELQSPKEHQSLYENQTVSENHSSPEVLAQTLREQSSPHAGGVGHSETLIAVNKVLGAPPLTPTPPSSSINETRRQRAPISEVLREVYEEDKKTA